MDKLLQAGSIAIASFLVVGSVFFPDKGLMWIASTSLAMDIARVVLIAMMVGLLVTKPPRDSRFRALLGGVGLAFGGWAVTRIFRGSVNVLDVVLFMEAAVVFGIEALEQRPAPQTQPAEVQLRPEVAVQEDYPTVYEPYPEILRQVWPLLLFMGRRVIAVAAISINASGLKVADYSGKPGRRQAITAYRRLIPVVYTPP